MVLKWKESNLEQKYFIQNCTMFEIVSLYPPILSLFRSYFPIDRSVIARNLLYEYMNIVAISKKNILSSRIKKKRADTVQFRATLVIPVFQDIYSIGRSFMKLILLCPENIPRKRNCFAYHKRHVL